MRYSVGLLTAVGAVLVATPAFADALSAPAGLSATATGEVLYDSNQLRSLSATNRHSDDIRYSPAGVLDYNHRLGRGTIALTGLVGHDFFQYNHYLDRNRFGAGGVLNQSIGSRCTAVVNGNYSSRQNGIYSSNNLSTIPLDPTLPVIVDGPPDDVGRLIDNRQIFATYGANANCGSPGGRLSFGGGVVRSTIDNGSQLRSFANSNSMVYSLYAGLGVFRPGQLQINGSYSTIDYPNRLIPLGSTISPVGLNTGVKTYRAGLTYSRPIGAKLSGSIGLSYLTARPEGGQSPYSAPAYDVSLNYHPSPRLSFAAVGSRSVLSSSSSGALFRVVDAFQLSATYDVSNTISTHANVGLTANNYKQPFTIPGEIARVSDTSKIVGVGMNYTPRPLYDIAVQVSEIFRSSNPRLYNYDSTRVSLTLSVHV
ncbi:outer membrane beta-barrel protein [Polymorphobacter sp. PAMC 29334]|uniref:outer membrane beta-barrel protein n=1 Tax=Polymorphobacter sp. PAMC 29334 TaxID=2862331 RepID=UPI001C76D4DE|nr:outer membrane beta-barrel protein [Polymorphobacter sp. PAMC 29334]QYE34152.1 outer membrane beta-barrel protein [Polymorphobacter sp. PAMC 29334]